MAGDSFNELLCDHNSTFFCLHIIKCNTQFNAHLNVLSRDR